MPLLSDTTATTTTTMEPVSHWGDISPQIQEQTDYINERETTNPSSSSIDHEFNESECLFCDQSSSSLDDNLVHMSKVHGLHVTTRSLLVDVGSLIAYFHLVISSYHECLYCGTQRNTTQAIQQHIIAKGHCKYDLTAKDAEFREFYDFSALEAEEELHRNRIATRLSDRAQLAAHRRLQESRLSRHYDKYDANITTLPSGQWHTSTNQSQELQSEANSTPSSLELPLGLSNRAQKQAYAHDNQLAQLRANDRQSLMHLPISQQRALLSTHHKQMGKAKRSEQTQRGKLESAGNSFARLGTIRLIRKPPHTGRVQTLKR